MSTIVIGASAGLYPGGDGITRVTDPFWKVTCAKCGHIFLSCICTSPCPKCGCLEGDKFLGGIPYNQVIEERGRPILSE